MKEHGGVDGFDAASEAVSRLGAGIRGASAAVGMDGECVVIAASAGVVHAIEEADIGSGGGAGDDLGGRIGGLDGAIGGFQKADVGSRVGAIPEVIEIGLVPDLVVLDAMTEVR